VLILLSYKLLSFLTSFFLSHSIKIYLIFNIIIFVVAPSILYTSNAPFEDISTEVYILILDCPLKLSSALSTSPLFGVVKFPPFFIKQFLYFETVIIILTLNYLRNRLISSYIRLKLIYLYTVDTFNVLQPFRCLLFSVVEYNPSSFCVNVLLLLSKGLHSHSIQRNYFEY
jgi:hypothetical protein